MKTTHLLAAACISGIVSVPVLADDSLLGTYVGAGLGQANVRIDRRPGDIALGLKENHTAWKATFGIRPISLVGIELGYVDLGRVDQTLGGPALPSTVVATVRQSGGSVHALGYLPLPVPLLDVFGKVGTTQMQTRLDGFLPALTCVAAGCNEFHARTTDTVFSWGMGAQVKLPLTGLSLRSEYERWSVPNGAPDLLSLSLLWRF